MLILIFGCTIISLPVTDRGLALFDNSTAHTVPSLYS